jgi:beta-galactosidase
MKLLPRRLGVLLAVMSLVLVGQVRAATPSVARERLLMDFGWKFHLGDEWGIGYSLAKAGEGYGPASKAYSDASWRNVDLPHDWAIELPFDPKADASHGFKALGEGYSQNSVGWYRRTFNLPASDTGRRLWLEFDGVYRDCTVFVNGWFVGHHESGYNGFRYDITDVAACGGKNVVTVKVDASQFEGWFYEGAGIYRHVWLVKTAPVAVEPDGVFVFSHFKGNVPVGDAEIHMQARVSNTSALPVGMVITWQVIAPDGTKVASVGQSENVGARADLDVEKIVMIPSPRLWSPETPDLYRLVTVISDGLQALDRVETPFGIRTVGFDADRGFVLNGKSYTLKGTSNHQDHAGVGSALPDALQNFRIARLKEMGCNAYRTTHNSPTPELLDACDRLGMLVMDENRLLGSDAQHIALLDEQLRRDRNHPSVAIWSVGNEEFEVAGRPDGKRVAATMQDYIRQLDPTRPVTYNAPVADEFSGINEIIEVRGWSYRVGPGMDSYHKEHPLQPNVGSEQGSTVSTRGIYANDKVRGYVSAYDDNAPPWAQTAEQWMSFFGTRPWMSGGFVWTGFDYRGEPTPYAWPCINSHFGIMDTCGFPKDNFWYYQAWWTDRPVLHILPHWNWEGREGQGIDVRALSNCDEVELFLNGRSVGRESMKPYLSLKWKVPYAPGALTARGYKGGKKVVEAQVETTGAPAAVVLKPDREIIEANGQDAAVFTVSIVDAQGRVVPIAGNKISFSLEGPGHILGVGNGDPSSHESDTRVATAESRKVPLEGWHWEKVGDSSAENMPEESASFDDSGWEAVDVQAETGSLAPTERAIYRGHFSVSAKDLGSSAVELCFQRISGGVAVYVNGTRTGGSIDSKSAPVFDVKKLLHPGENVVAVATANWDAQFEGISKGVALRLQEAPEPVEWSRSAFNGLAEVIVQSSKAAGTLRLTASSNGLKPVLFDLQSRPSPTLAEVP